MKLGGQDREIRSKDCIPRKVWIIMTKDTQDALRKGCDINIGLVKEDSFQSGKPGGSKISVQFNKNWKKLLHLTGMEGRTTNTGFMKEVNDLLYSNTPKS